MFLGNGCFLFSVSFGPARSLALRFTHSSALRLFRAVACSSLLRIQTCNRAAAFVAISAATLQHRGPNTSFPSFNNSYQRWCPTPSALDSNQQVSKRPLSPSGRVRHSSQSHSQCQCQCPSQSQSQFGSVLRRLVPPCAVPHQNCMHVMPMLRHIRACPSA